ACPAGGPGGQMGISTGSPRCGLCHYRLSPCLAPPERRPLRLRPDGAAHGARRAGGPRYARHHRTLRRDIQPMQPTPQSPNCHHPEILRWENAPERIDELRRRPGVLVSDAIEAQLRDLVRTRHPARRLTPAEQQDLVTAELGGRALHQYGVWVHYPWSRRLVHLLDEPEFIEVRTNRNCYKITPAEQRQLSTKRVGVVGLSVGQSVSLSLALERSFGELRLADFDTLDLSNLNRL